MTTEKASMSAGMKLLMHGAEAEVYADGATIIKKRQKKEYRIPELDEKLRITRTKREAKILTKLAEASFPVPKLVAASETELTLELIEGKKIKDILREDNYDVLCTAAGKLIGALHGLDIIHGDLTTSNMLHSKKKVFLIDFGLSFFSEKAEDKAVDIHLFKQALRSSHSALAERCFDAFLQGYLHPSEEGEGGGEEEEKERKSDVVERLKKVEARGRYKGKDKGEDKDKDKKESPNSPTDKSRSVTQ